MQYYQGDVPALKIKELPKGIQFKKMTNDVVVAEGETTGHSHRLQVKDRAKVEIAQDKNGYYLKIDNGEVDLIHDTHKKATLDDGLWFVGKQFEYDEEEEFRKVQD